ncbi:hypothetical protein IQ265_08745 [Nodosilinea sp. LEGE 06152]|nr:hypothetical protein [Nodosilinea sp. LEGE 06152]MBE9156915.1 hypothetical protein [Nodosilinea sp. LEGE 06152]
MGREACSVLRLCDRNFRSAYPGPFDQRVAALNLNLRKAAGLVGGDRSS